MSFVIAVPEALTMAASDLANIGSTINAANAAAALPTTGVVAAAADEVFRRQLRPCSGRTRRAIRLLVRSCRRFTPSSCSPLRTARAHT